MYKRQDFDSYIAFGDLMFVLEEKDHLKNEILALDLKLSLIHIYIAKTPQSKRFSPVPTR